ncbi:N-acetyltransferase [Clostridium chromiireducens]|uniref:N-acetyltransferase n=1 Tax=Clostridium chromiireducens TaxID=225345 RepID=A0A1V4IRU0_9CLOT|nr:N-acetyltransferase [Clostridium chromiireducens]OPJ62623.1 putative N-acetyltransferase YjaB [Clostridium chromiireducens]RII33248.1 N-acetyltransferase [Clostridium chromiireducens]
MISRLNKNEVDEIMRIWLDASMAAHDFIDKQYWIDKYEVVKNEYIPNSETFVYKDKNEIKGFISIINENFIGALFVDNKNQCEGIGSRLIDFVINKYNELSLTVYKDNLNAVDFYKKHNFKIISEDLDEDTNKVEFMMMRQRS